MSARATKTTMMVLATAAACTAEVPAPREQAVPAPTNAEAGVTAPPATPGPVTPAVTPAVPPAATPAAIPLTFSPVLEGQCPALAVSLVSGEAFIHGEPGHMLARVLPDGGTEDLSIDMSTIGGDPYYVEVGHIEAVEGTWPDDLWLRYLQVDGRMWEGSRYLRRKDGAWSPLATPEEEERNHGVARLFRWTGDNWLAQMDCRDSSGECSDPGLLLKVVRGPGKAPKFPELRSRIDACWTRATMTVLPDGEIVAVGRFCHDRATADDGGAFYAVRWSEPRGTTIERLPVGKGYSHASGPLLAASATQIYAAIIPMTGDAPATLLRFDGATWTTLPPLAGRFAAMDLDRDGSLWAIGGGELSRSVGDGWERQAFLTGPARGIGGLRDPVGWVAQDDGTLWMRQDGGDFTRVELPAPAYSTTASYVVETVASAGRDVWVTAKYAEKGPGRAKAEQRRALLRNGPARAPLRCAEDPQYRPTRGSYAWPLAARDDCATPYAILIRPSISTPRAFAYPALGKALKGQQAFASAKFGEVEIGGQRLVGAAVPGVAEGRALVEWVAQKVARSRPELVCATPIELRPLPFDLATGKLSTAPQPAPVPEEPR